MILILSPHALRRGRVGEEHLPRVGHSALRASGSNEKILKTAGF